MLPPGLLDRLERLNAQCVVYNHYGPTETTIGVLVNVLGRMDDAREYKGVAAVPLGRAIANIETYILDDWQQIVPPGVIGELYVGGAGLAIGYLHQPEQTAARFVPHPFHQGEGARLYRTGDLVCYTAEGQIEFAGRRDRQVKLRGYRVELHEVDAVVRKHVNVWDAVTTLREDMESGPYIVGYIVPRQFPAPTSNELRDFVREYLPDYMVPSGFVSLKVFPLTANGKVDWRQLPRPELEQEEGDAQSMIHAVQLKI